MVFRECYFLADGTVITLDQGAELLRLVEMLDQNTGA